MTSDSWYALRERVTHVMTDVLNESLHDESYERRALAVRVFVDTVDPEDGLVKPDVLEQMVVNDAEGWMRHLLALGMTVEVGRRLLDLKRRAALIER